MLLIRPIKVYRGVVGDCIIAGVIDGGIPKSRSNGSDQRGEKEM